MGKVENKMLEEFLLKKSEMLVQFSQYIGIDNLNYSVDELKIIESKASNLIDDEKFAESYNVYIGEILIKNISGGYWVIDNLKKDIAFHKPAILNSIDKSRMRLCPIVDWFGLLKKGRLREGISGIVEKVIMYQNAKE